MSRALRSIFAFIAALAICASASGQQYPDKPVKLVVAYAPGGTPDVIARVLAQRLSKSMGQQFIVENKPGAGGLVANQAVAKSPPDGYTLLVADVGQLAVSQYLFANPGFDTMKDFAPIGLVAITPLFIAINPNLKITTFKEFVAYAKANPGKLSYGSAGIGSIHQLSMEMLKADLGLDITHVPYKGSGQSVPAFLAGDIPVVAGALPALLPAVKSNKTNLLAVTSLKRFSHSPNVPAVSEFVKDYDYPSEVGFLAPAGTPRVIITKLNAELNAAIKEPEVIERMESLGSDPAGGTPEDYAQNLKANLAKYQKAVRVSGAKAE
jgi:tripartite-type tricarboxylate transporter receptor subunit TctC